ncbi:hypothetical protein PITC_029180 [Penicillium italicum]|uniref:Uncharacterized protein n=1 Tax=Penicillium italicum TaxID=40296 RepID=A0A0A2KJH8_PENIT|nr:hypothetical protein PITC_029180 [Penicillium italicum]
MMSGNYDYPRASSSSSRRRSRTTRPDERQILPLQHLRNLVSERIRSGGHNAHNATLALETFNREFTEHLLDRADDHTNFERAAADVDHQSETADPTDPVRGIWLNQIRSERTRTTLSPDSHSLHHILPWQTLIPSPDGSLPRSPPLMPPSSQSGRDGQGRMKRRKLDTDDHREEFRGFDYGQYGQVVPGVLQMEIASCDGGSYDPDSACSRPENILDNNTSVYSTKEARCNLVLCHRGEAPFCLKKIVIKAPQCGFDAPGRSRRSGRRSGMQPSQEYLTGFRPPLQNLERTVLMSPHSAAVPHTAEDPQAQFRITTEYDENNEDSADDEDWRSALLERTQAEQMEDPSSDTDESPSDEEDPSSRNQRRRQVESERTRALSHVSEQRPRHTPSLVHPNPPAEPAHPTAEVLKPHARFFIEREKSMVTIKFDPPPSGRFILIKLWSPRAHGNIDIESIIAHGYAGPRFFPSIAAR